MKHIYIDITPDEYADIAREGIRYGFDVTAYLFHHTLHDPACVDVAPTEQIPAAPSYRPTEDDLLALSGHPEA